MATLSDRWKDSPLFPQRLADQQAALGIESWGVVACAYCLRFKGSRTCAAFPDKIPDEIWRGNNYHLVPIQGDNGLQFLPQDDDARRLVEAWANRT